MPLKKVKFCRMCQIKLTSSNSYYPKSTHLQCKNCYHKSRTKYVVKYRKSIKGKKATKVAATRAYINHKFKFVARAKVSYAVIKGLLKKPKKCEVCEEIKPLQGHHEDYSKPLEVIWLCTRCHADADRKLESKNKTNL